MASRTPEAAHRGGLKLLSQIDCGSRAGLVAESTADGREGVLEHRRCVQVEGALLVALALVSDVIDPHRRDAQVFDQ